MARLSHGALESPSEQINPGRCTGGWAKREKEGLGPE